MKLLWPALAVLGFFAPRLLGSGALVYGTLVVIAIFAVMAYGLDIILSDLGEVSLDVGASHGGDGLRRKAELVGDGDAHRLGTNIEPHRAHRALELAREISRGRHRARRNSLKSLFCRLARRLLSRAPQPIHVKEHHEARRVHHP